MRIEFNKNNFGLTCLDQVKPLYNISTNYRTFKVSGKILLDTVIRGTVHICINEYKINKKPYKLFKK